MRTQCVNYLWRIDRIVGLALLIGLFADLLIERLQIVLYVAYWFVAGHLARQSRMNFKLISLDGLENQRYP